MNHVLPAWDLLTGAYAAFATLSAERHRRMTGIGQEVTVPLSDMAMASLGHMGQIAEVLTGGDRPRMGNALFGAFGRDFATADGQRVMVVAITAKQWSGLLEALQLHAPIAQIEATYNVSFAHDEDVRFKYRAVLFPVFERAIEALALPALKSAFDQNGVCWGAYQSLSHSLREDPRLSLQNPLFQMLEHPSGHQ